MCLDFEMLVWLFLFWIALPLLLMSGVIFVVIKLIGNKKLK